MVEFTIKSEILGLKEISRKRNRVRDTRPAIRAIARYLKERIEDNWGDETDPVTGVPWKPLKQSTLDAKSPITDILVESGNLQGSLDFKFARGHLEIFSSGYWYAKIHQEGWGTPGSKGSIPQRRFLGISPEMLREARDMVDSYIDRGATGKF